MPRQTEPNIPGPSALLSALRDQARNLREQYADDPMALAERFGLMLPQKPVSIMLELGVITEEEAEEQFGKLEPGLREFVVEVCTGEVDSAAAVGPRGGGKDLSLMSPIPTPDGWTTMGEVQVGDLVFAADGTPTPVVWKSEIMHNNCHEVEFDDGSSVICGESHEWVTLTANQRRRIRDRQRRPTKGIRGVAHNQGSSLEPQRTTTAEMAATLHDPTERRKLSPNHTIDNCAPLQLPEADLPIDPWVLGVWLGDGTSHAGWICSGEEDRESMERLLCDAGYPVKKATASGGGWLLKVPRLHEELRHTGILQNKSVPEIYMRASLEQRLALIRGLMDTDGTTRNSNNNCQFSQKDDELVMQFAELVVSMGWKYTISLKQAVCQTGARYKHLLCSFNPDQQVYSLPRKAARLDFNRGQRGRFERRYVTEVRLVDTVPTQCIQVAHPSHQYLVGEGMIPTHNSQGVSFTEFFLVFVKDYDALNLGGSELQAEQVYRYLVAYIDSDNYWRTLLKGDTLQSKTETVENAWIRVLAASSKSVRSPHAGGRKPGGRMAGAILVIDEEAEAESDIVEAALFTINTATPSVSARCSTFHNAEGSFAELIDNHDEMGYKLYRWDIFDVCSGCSCGPEGCESDEKCFREDHMETVIDPETGEAEEKLIHKAYCGGRARYARGWVPIGEIVKTWKRLNRSHERFEVEAMGSRPSTKGFVIKDQIKFASNFTSDTPAELYLPGGPVTICVDWGTVAAGITVWQEQYNSKIALLHAEELHEAGESAILGEIITLWDRFPDAFEVAADIGGGGNYLNKKLREEMSIPCRDVNFATDKESAAAAWNILNEGENLIYPSQFTDFKKQGRKWKRDKGGRIKKGNDHIMDSGLCFFSKFIDELGVAHIRVPPRTFHAQPRGGIERTPVQEVMDTHMIRPVVVGIGSRRR